ncbi:hypothetical protein QTN25_007323 [Entamoeba marina]
MENKDSPYDRRKDKDQLKKVKYESVDRKVGIQSLYYAVLTSLGFTLLLEKPKKQKTKTLPLIQLYQVFNNNGACVFDRDVLFTQANQKNIGCGKTNSKRTVRQYVSNETVNSIIKLIESHPAVQIKEGRSKKNIVNEDIPQQRKIEAFSVIDGCYKIAVDLNQQALSNGKKYHEALLKIFEEAQSDGIIIGSEQFNIGFIVTHSNEQLIDSIALYFSNHTDFSCCHATFVPVLLIDPK